MTTILVEQAKIHTATVQIATLTVSGKQVTQGVFRQVLNEEILDENLVQKGAIWGTVNYHWSECKGSGEHQHVVWQKGDQLRRWTFWRPRFDDRAVETEHATKWLDSAIVDGWRPADKNKFELRLRVYVRFPDDIRVEIQTSEEARHFLNSWSIGHDDTAMLASTLDGTVSTMELHDRVLCDVRATIRERTIYKDLWNSLDSVPQLFIAV